MDDIVGIQFHDGNNDTISLKLVDDMKSIWVNRCQMLILCHHYVKGLYYIIG